MRKALPVLYPIASALLAFAAALLRPGERADDRTVVVVTLDAP